MSAATNSNESYCTFTLASDVTAGGLPSEEEIAKQLESNDPKVCLIFYMGGERVVLCLPPIHSGRCSERKFIQ